jgi:hypothetical protein
MHEVVQTIDYKGYQIQERRLMSAGGAVVPTPGGGRQVVPSAPVPLTQWAIVKSLPGGKEQEVALASSEADAKHQVDELVNQEFGKGGGGRADGG